MSRARAIVIAALACACTRGYAAEAEGSGRQTADGGRRTADGGQPAAESAPRTAESARRTADSGPRTADRPPGLARELPLAPGRTVYYALPREGGPVRLIGHIHGVCGGPPYACGKWLGAATEVGAIVCPTGNTPCGDTASWEAPSWQALVLEMDRDLEKSVGQVGAAHPGALSRDDAILTGFSRGGFAVPEIARMHPGRWPLLAVIEANAPMHAPRLREAGVRKVALVAAEHGAERAGMTRTHEQLVAARVPSRLFIMPRSSHLYPDDIDAIMRRVLGFLTEASAEGTAATDGGPFLRTSEPVGSR